MIVMSQRYYAVRVGRAPGVYTDVEEYRKQVDGFPNSVSMRFRSPKVAEAFVLGKTSKKEKVKTESKDLTPDKVFAATSRAKQIEKRMRPSKNVVAYIDGSYDEATLKYSYAAVIVKGNGEELLLCGIGQESQASPVGSIISELAASASVMDWAKSNKIKAATIVYDCAAIVDAIKKDIRWPRPAERKYRKIYHSVSEKAEIEFRKIQGHSGNRYHDIADALARQTLGLEIKETVSKYIDGAKIVRRNNVL